MKKGRMTKSMILVKAAELFNRHGYAGTSLSELMQATGLEKGGIYNHFGSKDQLALEAFDYAAAQVKSRIEKSIENHSTSSAKLSALLDSFLGCAMDPPITGGCPLLNTATESDFSHPLLKERVKAAFTELLALIVSLIEAGKQSGEFRQDIYSANEAAIIVAALEGSIMLACLFGEIEKVSGMVDFLQTHIKQWRLEP